MSLKTNPVECEQHYFNSYAQFSIHEEMIKDAARTNGYSKAISSARNLFRGKVVMDVGCGTGILSMFAANAGAAKVYAVEASEIAHYAKKIVEDNMMSDVITVLHSMVEDVVLPEKSVDIIISEWMGYTLYFESMIESVIFARDKWLKKGGMMFPDIVTVKCAGLDDKGWLREKQNWWNQVHGFNMSAIGKDLRHEPLTDIVQKRNIISPSIQIQQLNMETVSIKQLYMQNNFALKMMRDGLFDGLIVSFDIIFSHGAQSVTISTAPESQPTHWKQMIYYIPESKKVKKGQTVMGSIQFTPAEKNRRNIDVNVKIGNITCKYVVN